MSKHWNPGKTAVKLHPPARPSRIRRDPVRINANVPAKRERPSNYRERELVVGIAGIIIFAAAITAGVIALAMFTVFRGDPAADARAAQFGQCYNSEGANCVLDGGTIYVRGVRVEIAGMVTPKIVDARCDAEQARGIQAAVQLAEILNSGPVTVGAPTRDSTGRMTRKVEVSGRDVALKMIDRDLAREAGSDTNWCR